jgi:hypothetical protein
MSDPGTNVVLLGCYLATAGYNSAGIVTYDIHASYGYLSSNIINIEKSKVIEFYVACSSIEEWIGNRLVEISSENYKERFDYSVSMIKEEKSSIDQKRSIGIISNAQIPLGIQNEGNFIISQRSAFVFSSDEPFSIDSIVDTANLHKQLLSFFCSRSIGIKEIYFIKKRKFGNKYRKQKVNLLVSLKSNRNETKNTSGLIEFQDYFNKMGIVYKRWESFIEKNKYAYYFFDNYFSTSFVDQRLLASIVLLEKIHNSYFKGIKREMDELDQYIKSIEIALPSDIKDEIIIALKERNGLSLKSKLENFSDYAQNKADYLASIPRLVRFRNDMAHGSGMKEITIDEQIKLHRTAIYVICNFITKKVLEIESKKVNLFST